jgi:beta-mannosidase
MHTLTPIDAGWELAERLPPGRDLFQLQGGERLWLSATIPGHVHTDLVRAGVLPDPFVRLGEWGARWVDEADWTYRTTFTLTQAQADACGDGRHFLVFDGLDTIARIFLNETPIGSVENAFITHRFDVTRAVRAGANTLRVEFDSALRVGRERAAAYLGDGTSERGRQTYFNFPPRAFVRKPQYMFGWDWGPEIAACGIHGAVSLLTVPRAEIVDWRLATTFTGENTVDMTVTLTVAKYDHTPLTAGIALYAPGDNTPAAPLPDAPGTHTVTLTVTNQKVTRWQINGHGAQRRYLLNLRVWKTDDDEDAEKEFVAHRGVSVGFRTVELLRPRDPDGRGEGFLFRINGRNTYMKGANWIPDHSLPSRITRERLRERLTQARDAGFTMLRVWGGGLYETEAFYDLCDELGILVWQDFAFACAMYPDDLPEFVENVRAEAVASVRRLRHRASLALWCGGNENLELFQGRWSGEAQATTFFGDALIHRVLPEVLAEEDAITPYWPNSPYGAATPGGNCQSEDYGDAHYWNVWHAKEPTSDGDWVNYTKCDCRFSSEFGFAAPASETAWDTCLAPEDRTVHSPVTQWHDKTRKDPKTYLGFVTKHFPAPRTFDDLIYYGQANQALALAYGIEHWRRRKGRCWGTLFWQLNDCWPTQSWAVVDSAGEPKLAYHAVRRVYREVLLSLERAADGKSVHGYLVNDTDARIGGRLSLRVLTFDGQEVARAESDAFALPNASSGPILRLVLPSFVADSGEDVFVHATFTSESSAEPLAESFLMLAEPKNLRLSDPALNWDFDGTTITVTARRFAAFVRIRFDGVARQPELSDNGFHLAPGQTRTIHVKGLPEGLSLAESRARLCLRTL